MRQTAIFAAVAVCLAAFFSPAGAQPLIATQSDWMDKLDRQHNRLVPPSGHVHARGKIQTIDTGPGASITIFTEKMESPDGSIRMQAMEMPFHVTNRHMLKGLRPGDLVEFEAARLKNAVMITNIRKAR
jgi:Cu/Ag efflux protein CusF